MTQRVFFSAAIVLLCGCFAITVTSAPPGRVLASVVMSGRASSQANEFVYVANGSGPVTAYQSGSLGKVEPALLINNPKLSNTYWDLWDVVFDRLGNLYAQTFLSDATTFVFAPHAMATQSRSACSWVAVQILAALLSTPQATNTSRRVNPRVKSTFCRRRPTDSRGTSTT